MSEKRLLGWEPTQTHTHIYDEQGRLAQTIVVTESEWDEVQRESMLALAIHEAGIGPCGFHHALTRDPDAGLTVQLEDEVCPVCAGLASYDRKQEADDKAAEPKAPRGMTLDPLTPRPGDGRRTLIRQVPQRDKTNPGGSDLRGRAS